MLRRQSFSVRSLDTFLFAVADSAESSHSRDYDDGVKNKFIERKKNSEIVTRKSTGLEGLLRGEGWSGKLQ